MSVQTQVPLLPALTILPLRPADLATAAPGPAPWLLHGYLAQGGVTALVSQSKSGKTKLVAHLLARTAQGGQLAGLAVRPGWALVVSEEATSDWDPRTPADIGPDLSNLFARRCADRMKRSPKPFARGHLRF